MPSEPVPAADFLLEHMSRALWDPVDPHEIGSLDPRLHTRVNGEIYRFSRRETLLRFRHEPVRWCGVLRDPVNAKRFIPNRVSRRLDYTDGPYFFCGDSTFAVFRANPTRYAIHRLE
jgi:YHS domain-containing protein